ncbi:amino acid permease [Pontibacillus halophilus JSM 076056 = DSM 19796]|uniref:Amino acid permease n=1 Tax=Pontibacillus halophilus JSM 076056 = DSM 19796 TaxID=1385510 RepID=A0A0A5GN41_9BACI|nr:amino acid permease [Pontibacillus halophilus]KGX92658.1 amino acid permease [Pontibacillus halophilus JSM 076056 = DSM 19796]
MKQTLGPLALSGLMIGPILGSGIILLPTLVYDTTGEYAIFAWVAMMLVTFLFAFLFAKISVRYPGDGGVTIAIYKAFGERYRKLAAIYFMMAASIGPIAVLMTADTYVDGWLQLPIRLEGIGIVLMILCMVVLINNVQFIGKASFIFSTFAVLVLFTGGVTSLLTSSKLAMTMTEFHLPSFGSSLLLLFWMLVGWEIVGNYSGEVRNPNQTIHRAVLYSASIVTVVSVTVAGAVQWYTGGPVTDLSAILQPLFGSWSMTLITLVTVSLCMTTYILVTGGVARLVASQPRLPHWVTKRTDKGVPLVSLSILAMVHLIVFFLVYLDLVSIDTLVKAADVFFIGNALIAVSSVFRTFQETSVRIMASAVAVILVIILCFSSKLVLGIAGGVAIVTILTTKNIQSVHKRAINE